MSCKLIDADRLLVTLRKAKSFGELTAKKAIRFVEEAPTVETVKHGKWTGKVVMPNKEIDEWQAMQCSVCGAWHTEPYRYYIRESKYCPECGARMDGEDDGTETD